MKRRASLIHEIGKPLYTEVLIERKRDGSHEEPDDSYRTSQLNTISQRTSSRISGVSTDKPSSNDISSSCTILSGEELEEFVNNRQTSVKLSALRRFKNRLHDEEQGFRENSIIPFYHETCSAKERRRESIMHRRSELESGIVHDAAISEISSTKSNDRMLNNSAHETQYYQNDKEYCLIDVLAKNMQSNPDLLALKNKEDDSDDSDECDTDFIAPDELLVLHDAMVQKLVKKHTMPTLLGRKRTTRRMKMICKELIALRQTENTYNEQQLKDTLNSRGKLYLIQLSTLLERTKQINRRHWAQTPDGVRFTIRFFPGLDYRHPSLKLTRQHIENPCSPPSRLDISTDSRLPVHSVGVAVFGDAAMDVARHFIERWNFSHDSIKRKVKRWPIVKGRFKTLKDSLQKIPKLMPRGYHDDKLLETELLIKAVPRTIEVNTYARKKQITNISDRVNLLAMNLDEHLAQQYDEMANEDSSKLDASETFLLSEANDLKNEPRFHNRRADDFTTDFDQFVECNEYENCMDNLSQGRRMANCKVTVIRTLGKWSGGEYKYMEEESILEAYCRSIAKATKFVYIENELFISQSRNRSSENLIKNKIGYFLYRKILLAHQTQRPFRIYIVIPRLPREAGDLTEETDDNLKGKKLMHHMFNSLFVGENSLVSRLLQRNIPISEYLMVCNLRKFDKIDDGWVLQDIHVSSNILIADDTEAIIGSAHIADHSMLGYKNSELAVHIQEINKTSPDFTRSLRLKLWGEHLSLNKLEWDKILEPQDVSVWNLWKSVATQNFAIIKSIIHVIPREYINTPCCQSQGARINFIKKHPSRTGHYDSAYSSMKDFCEKLTRYRGHLVFCNGRYLDGFDLRNKGTKAQRWRLEVLWPDFSLV